MSTRTAWRPGDDERPVKLGERMPDEDELEDTPRGARAVSLLLRANGINPWHVSAREDALDVDGWLRPTGRLTASGNDLELERVPWNLPAETVTEILELFWKIDWNGYFVPPPPPPEPAWAKALVDLAQAGLTVRPPYRPEVPRENYLLAVRYWKARVGFWAWLSVATGFGGFSLGWAAHTLLGLALGR